MEQMGANAVDYMSLAITYTAANSYLKISQKGYIEKWLKAFGINKAKPAPTPMASGVKFTKANMPEEVDPRRRDLYRRMLGVARWIIRMSCPEACFAVSYLACYLENPSQEMLNAAVYLFRYFKWTIENDVEGRCFTAPKRTGIIPPGFNVRVGKNQVYGYIDASYLSEERAACRYGVVFFINAMCIYELSKRLTDIAVSSTEAEYLGASLGAREGMYIRMVLEAMQEPQTGPMLIGQDNKSCIQIIENPGRHHGRTKHIDVQMRWIEKAVEDGKIALVYVNTKYMVADVTTKSLCYELHARHTTEMKGQRMPEYKAKRKAESRLQRESGDDMET